jgi:outer membrane murein-binding lipoprotein Lpp
MDYFFQLVGLVGAAGAVYAAIRSDLSAIREKAEHAAIEASKAHERIDSLLMSNMRGLQ